MRGRLLVYAGFVALLALATMASLASASANTRTSASTRVRISVTQRGSVPPYRGFYLLNYPARGTIRGTAAGAPPGTALVLSANAFPFTTGFVPLARTTTHARGAFTFRVRPSIATRYRVALASAPAVSSRTVTFYLQSENFANGTGSCTTRPVCVLRFSSTKFHLPSAVAAAELGKVRYLYVGVTRGSQRFPALLRLMPSVPVTIQLVAGTLYRESFAVPINVGTGSFAWVVNTCALETEAADGWGIPVHTGCGARTVTHAQLQRIGPYLG